MNRQRSIPSQSLREKHVRVCNIVRSRSSDVNHRGALSGSVGQRKHSIFTHSLFVPVFNQRHSVICFSTSVSLLCYDNLMRYLVAKETKASPQGGRQGTRTAFEEKRRRAYRHQMDRNMTRNGG